jgi:hypothetical protein
LDYGPGRFSEGAFSYIGPAHQAPSQQDLFCYDARQSGFDLSGGFAANGYAEHSPGGYGLASALICELVDDFIFLMIIMERQTSGRRRICAQRHRTDDADSSDQHPGRTLRNPRSTSQALPFVGGLKAALASVARLWELIIAY